MRTGETYPHESLKRQIPYARGVYRFAYFYTPVPIRGATGSIGSPSAVW
jgi:hypothetical protein